METHRPAHARDGALVFRGLLVAGLLLTIQPGNAKLHDLVLTALPVVGGLVLGAALVRPAPGPRPTHPLVWFHMLFVWWLTLSPVMGAQRELVRTCTVSAALALWMYRRSPLPSERAGRTPSTIAVWVLALLALTLTLATLPQAVARGVMSELKYGLGGAWPRGWGHIARDATLFHLGCWMAQGPRILAVGRWRGIALPLRSLAAMPATTAALNYAVVVALVPVAPAERLAPWATPSLVGLLLVAQMAFAVRWLRTHDRGPVEACVRAVGLGIHTGVASSRAWVMRGLAPRHPGRSGPPGPSGHHRPPCDPAASDVLCGPATHVPHPETAR
jgi:hypothetical protein